MRGIADKAFAKGLQRHPAEPAELRRHRAPAAGLTTRADARRRLRAARGRGARRHLADRRRRLLARRQPRAEAGRRLWRRAASRSSAASAAVSPVLELEACVARPRAPASNIVYQWNFVRGLKARMRRKNECFPGPLPDRSAGRDPDGARVRRGVYGAALRFRERRGLLPPRQRMRVVDRIRVPALVITAEDDPFVPPAPFRSPELAGNPHIRVVHDAARRALRLPRSRLCSGSDGALGRTPQQIVGWRKRSARPLLNSPDAPARPRRNLRLQLSGMARHVLPREVQHRQDARPTMPSVFRRSRSTTRSTGCPTRSCSPAGARDTGRLLRSR